MMNLVSLLHWDNNDEEKGKKQKMCHKTKT